MSVFSALPDFPLLVRNSNSRVAHARELLEAAGGPDFLLEKIAAGTKMVEIAKSVGVSIAQINAFLKATSDPAELEAAMVSQIRTRIELLDDDADQIEDLKKRFDAKKDLLLWQADKETEKYRTKQLETARGGVTINIDWTQFENAAPAATPHVDI